MVYAFLIELKAYTIFTIFYYYLMHAEKTKMFYQRYLSEIFRLIIYSVLQQIAGVIYGKIYYGKIRGFVYMDNGRLAVYFFFFFCYLSTLFAISWISYE